MRSRCHPGRCGAPGRDWGGGAASTPGPRPRSARAVHASPASASIPPGEPRGARGTTLLGIWLWSGPRGSGPNSAAGQCAFSLGFAILHKFSSWGWFRDQPSSVLVNVASGWGPPGRCLEHSDPCPLEFVLPPRASAGVGQVSSGEDLSLGPALGAALALHGRNGQGSGETARVSPLWASHRGGAVTRMDGNRRRPGHRRLNFPRVPSSRALRRGRGSPGGDMHRGPEQNLSSIFVSYLGPERFLNSGAGVGPGSRLKMCPTR